MVIVFESDILDITGAFTYRRGYGGWARRLDSGGIPPISK
jgi:hypothetical protein